jgi:hypothetical protein
MKTHCLVLKGLPFVAAATISCGLMNATKADAQPAYGYSLQPYFTHSANGLGFYFDSDLGVNIMQQFQSPRFGAPATFKMDPGVRFTASPGFDFVSSQPVTIGAEFDTGVLYNHIYEVNTPAMLPGDHGDYYQVPFLGSVVFKFHPDPFITPYLSVGAGGVYSTATVYQFHHYDNNVSAGETDPAVAASAGIRCKIAPFASIGAGYDFLGVIPGSNQFVGNHAIVASFNLDF